MTDGLVIFLLVLILACAVGALLAHDLTEAVVIFAAFSFFSAVLFAAVGAVDVAFTEAAVGGAITTLFFVSTLFRTDDPGAR
ncbi:MAG: DUF4040 domain-containing protein [Acidimicrobiia bacterium]|nr:DUF4040 domain-containing protein [Acidimicrobiia bacterium]